MINEILLRRKNKVLMDYPTSFAERDARSVAKVITIMKNIEDLGYTFDEDMFHKLTIYRTNDLHRFYTEFVAAIKPLVGADKIYEPMYPNFPQQVVDASDAELFFNAIVHYWSFGTLMPDYEKSERLPLFDNPKLKVLSFGTNDDLYDIFTNLLGAKTSLSVQDRSDIEWIIKNTTDWNKHLPKEIPLKENVGYFGKLVVEEKLPVDLSQYFKTATDILRLVVALSDGDISLATQTKFRKLRRSERRLVMDLLAKCNFILEDMFRYQNEWIRIGEVIHPGEFYNKNKAKYNSVFYAFDALRKDEKPLFFGGQLHKALNANDVYTAADLLKTRPGEFARLLDKCVRDAENPQFVIDAFKEVAEKVSVPVLLQVQSHFFWRVNPDDYRVIFPKGNTAVANVIPFDLPKINTRYCIDIANICEKAIIKQLATKEKLGKVYIDPELENYIVPFSQRSASSANKIVTRGSKFPIRKDAKAVRGFIWWTNTGDSRVDIDLSAGMYDEEWKWISHVSYTRLRDHTMKTYHSGDITNGGPVKGEGVAEFIDFDIESIAKNARYVVFQVYSYTQQPFQTLPNCRFGWMEREDVNSGEIFEPKTVEMNMDVRSNSTTCIPVIFDCKERMIIWCDMNVSLNANSRIISNNLENNLRNVNFQMYAVTHMFKTNMYDLACMHSQARGDAVFNREDADIIFSNDTTKPKQIVEVDGVWGEVEKDVPIITAFDLDYWVGQML